MTKINVNRKIEQLRRTAASSNVNSFASEISQLLEADFWLWFRILREQKLVSSFRDVKCIRELRETLLSKAFLSKVSATQLREIEHHFNVCEFMQEVFAQIDVDAASQPCRVAHPENMVRAVAGMVEMANYAFQKTTEEDARRGPQRISMLQIAGMQKRFRDVLDVGNIILNSRVARFGTDKNYLVGKADLNELSRLAFLYEEMCQVFDLYTYRGAKVRIKRHSLVVPHTKSDADIAAVVSAERSADYDHIRGTLLANLEVSVHKECETISSSHPDTFFSFLQKVSNIKAGLRAREFGQALANDLAFEIQDCFELATKITTAVGTFAVNELIQAWAFLVTLAMLGQRWNEARADISVDRSRQESVINSIPIPELSRRWLVRILAREVGLSRRRAERMIEQFTSRPAAGRIDLFYKPLLLLSDNAVLLPTPYIRGSRFERNLFVLIATESDLDQRKKGNLPILRLEQSFRKAGFQTLSNFGVQVDHKELTDIDLVAFKEGFLFLGQCKIVIEPDSLYETWKAERKLDYAAQQLDVCVAHLHEVKATLFERLRLKGESHKQVVPFILTNTRQFTDRVFGGYPVVDVPYLHFVLGGARVAVIGTASGRVGFGSGRSFIRGERPTAEELAGLLKRTLHATQKREFTYRHELRKIGDHKVHIPLMTMRTAGYSHIVSTEDEIFDDSEPVGRWPKIKPDLIRQNS